MKNQISKITGNPLGAVVGGVAFYYGAKKLGKVENMYILIGLSIVGAIAGASMIPNLLSKGAPTITTVTK